MLTIDSLSRQQDRVSPPLEQDRFGAIMRASNGLPTGTKLEPFLAA
jgi:hypothetical protein